MGSDTPQQSIFAFVGSFGPYNIPVREVGELVISPSVGEGSKFQSGKMALQTDQQGRMATPRA